MARKTTELPEASLSPGQACGRFTILSPLDRGPLLERYIALDPRAPGVGRRAVIALSRRGGGELGAPPDLTFLRTLARLKKITPSGAPRILSGGAAGGVAWAAAEHIAGQVLKAYNPLIDMPARTPQEKVLARAVLAVGLGKVIGTALKAFAERGFVHGDLDPRRNIVVSPDNEASVLDAGYGALFGVDRAALLADPMYRAPEQLDGGEGDLRSDIYSLGLILHEFIVGEPPFQASDPAALLARCRRGGPHPLVEVVGDPRVMRLSALIARATTADPAKRLQGWSEILDPLNEMIAFMFYVGEQKGILRPAGAPSPTSPRSPRAIGARLARPGLPSEWSGRDGRQRAYRARMRVEAAKRGRAEAKPSSGGGEEASESEPPSSDEDPPGPRPAIVNA